MRALPHCDTALLGGTRDGAQQTLSASVAQQSNDAGYEARNADDYVVTVLSVKTNSPESATATVCSTDGIVRVTPSATGDQVVNDDFTSIKAEFALSLSPDGLWKVSASIILDQATGREKNLCA
jgi:hypothetical protein